MTLRGGKNTGEPKPEYNWEEEEGGARDVKIDIAGCKSNATASSLPKKKGEKTENEGEEEDAQGRKDIEYPGTSNRKYSKFI